MAFWKKSQTLTGEPKNATCPLHNSRILSKAWKISERGWWIVTTMALPVPAITCRLFRMSREEAESRPATVCEVWGVCGRVCGCETSCEEEQQLLYYYIRSVEFVVVAITSQITVWFKECREAVANRTACIYNYYTYQCTNVSHVWVVKWLYLM